ncbi:hypothetical protein GCM10027517_11270 [Phycicoccus ginsengisoli]
MAAGAALYHDGWRAVCPCPGPSFTEAGKAFGAPISADVLTDLDAHGWQLYHVAEDFAENHDVADAHRDRLVAMIATWYVEAGRFNVLPVDARAHQRLLELRPTIAPPRDHYVYYPHTQAIPSNSAVNVLNRSHAITADVEIPPGGADGMLVSHGGSDAGYALFVKDGRLRWVHNYVAKDYPTVVSTEAVPEGRHQLRFEFEATGEPAFARGHGAPGVAQPYFDGRLVGQAEVPVTTPMTFGLCGGVRVGWAPGAPVCPDYGPPGRRGAGPSGRRAGGAPAPTRPAAPAHHPDQRHADHRRVALAAWLGAEPSTCIFRETCGQAQAREHNGDVYSCDHYVEPGYLLGNIARTRLLDLVSSPRQVTFGDEVMQLLTRGARHDPCPCGSGRNAMCCHQR